MKHERSISIADCFGITMSESLGVPVLFAKREEDSDAELRKRPFRTSFVFLDEI